MFKSRSLLVLSAFFASISARADILFVNLNGSYNEYLATKRAADELGEPFQMIPPFSSADLEKFRKTFEAHKEAGRQVDRYQEFLILEYGLSGCHEPSASDKPVAKRELLKKCWDAFKRMDEAAAVLGDFGNRYPEINHDELDRQLTAFAKKGVKFSSVVMSGHHDSGEKSGSPNFHGDLGRIDDEHFRKLKAKYPTLFGSLKTSHLMGCYSGTYEAASLLRSSFPGVRLIGFDDKAPLECTKLSADIVYEGLRSRELLVAAKTQADATTYLDGLNRKANVPKSCSVVIATENTYATQKGAFDILSGNCSEHDNQMAIVKIGEVEKYLRAEPGYDDFPADPERSVLRSAYTLLQQNQHCPQMKPYLKYLPRFPNIIHARDVTANFGVKFKSTIDAINAFEEHSGRKPIPDFSTQKMTRKQVVAEVVRLKESVLPLLATERNPYLQYSRPDRSILASVNRMKVDLVKRMERILISMETPGSRWRESSRDILYLDDFPSY